MIVSSMLEQYGIRVLSEAFEEISWSEFRALLIGLNEKTALGKIISIRAETDKDILKNYTSDQKKIRNDWLNRRAKEKPQEEIDNYLESLLNVFRGMSGND